MTGNVKKSKYKKIVIKIKNITKHKFIYADSNTEGNNVIFLFTFNTIFRKVGLYD